MTTRLRVDEKRANEPNTCHEVWLIVDGKPVAWATLMSQPAFNGYMCLCDIEVRAGYEGQGYAREITNRAIEEFGKPIAVTGSFTPEGFKAFNGKFPVLPVYGSVRTGPTFKSMKFVKDWDNFYGRR